MANTSSISKIFIEITKLSINCKLIVDPANQTFENKQNKRKKEKGVNYEGFKKCRRCGADQPRQNFNIDWRNADSLNSVCKDCDTARLLQRKNNITQIVSPSLTGDKLCTNCGTHKPRTFFNKDKFRPDGLFPWCKDCSRNNTNNHVKNNREKYRTYTAHRRELITRDRTSRDIYMSTLRRKRIKTNP